MVSLLELGWVKTVHDLVNFSDEHKSCFSHMECYNSKTPFIALRRSEGPFSLNLMWIACNHCTSLAASIVTVPTTIAHGNHGRDANSMLPGT